MKTALAFIVLAAGIALAAFGTFTHVRADVAVTHAAEALIIGGHAKNAPMNSGTQFTIPCAASGGTPTSVLKPDAGPTVASSSVYVAPVAGAASKVRYGYGAGLTASTGFELGVVGSGARDGVGITDPVEPAADPRCISEGAAQNVDVVVEVQK